METPPPTPSPMIAASPTEDALRKFNVLCSGLLLRRFAGLSDADREETKQQVLLSLCKYGQLGRVELQEDGAQAAYLRKCVHNEGRKQLRRKTRARIDPQHGDVDEIALDSHDELHRRIEIEAAKVEWKKVSCRITALEQRLLVRRFIEKRSYDEIGSEFGHGASWACKRVAEIRARLSPLDTVISLDSLRPDAQSCPGFFWNAKDAKQLQAGEFFDSSAVTVSR